MYIEKLASQIRNDVVSGLRGYHQNLSMNMDQLQDEIVACRLSILHQYFLRGIFPIKDLLIAINCIDVDCESLERCKCGVRSADDTVTAHFDRKYRKRSQKKPYVWIDFAPNANGMLDCFLFNAPFLQQVSVVAVFKDPRQLKQYSCCNTDELNGPDVNTSFIDQLVKEKLTKEKLYYYRQVAAQPLPNDQQYVTGG